MNSHTIKLFIGHNLYEIIFFYEDCKPEICYIFDELGKDVTDDLKGYVEADFAYLIEHALC